MPSATSSRRRNACWAALIKFVFSAALALSGAGVIAAEPEIRLYTLDCGHAEFKDFAPASDTGEFEGRPAVLADPCFLIRHPNGYLLWDAGLPATLPTSLTGGVGPAEMFARSGFRTWIDHPLIDQLQALGLRPDDIRYLAFSHLHFDHVGNANLFVHSTWILNRAEWAWAQATPSHVSMAPELISARGNVDALMIDGDHDVFGDGRVRILNAPGHTPGSSVLLLQLAKAGAVLLSGDLYVTMEGREHRQVPSVNANRADTLASMNRVEAIAKRLHARVVVQHAPADFESLPKPPAYLD